MEGDEGNIVAEHESQQRDFVDSSRNEGEEHLPKGGFRPCREQGCGRSVDDEDERRADDRIQRVGSELAKAHLSEGQSQRSSDDDLREHHEFFYSRDDGRSAQMRRETEREGTQQVRDGQAEPSRAEIPHEREGDEQQ